MVFFYSQFISLFTSLLEENIPDIEISSPIQEIEEFILQVEEQKQVEITVK